MDAKLLVNAKVFAPDTCTACVLGTTTSPRRPPRLAALITSKEDYAVFVYSLNLPSPKSPDDLNLELTFPVNHFFKFEPVSQTSFPGQGVPVKFGHGSDELVLLLARGPEFENLFKALQEAKQVFTQNAGFGLPSSFSWIDKYTGLPTPSINLFLHDVFDPFAVPDSNSSNAWKHELLSQNDVGKKCPVIKDDPFTLLNLDALKATAGVPPQTAPAPAVANLQNRQRVTIVTGSALPKTASNADLPEQIRRESLPASYGATNGVKTMGPVDLDEQMRTGSSNTVVSGGRENLVRLVMNSRADDFCDRIPFTIFCGTWNTNGQSANEPLEKWLAIDSSPPDIYALGFQELDLSKNAFIFSESAKESEWFQRCKEALHPKAKYKRLKLIRLVGMMLVVFIKEELSKHVYNCFSAQVGTGIMGMMGNKGGVGVRFELHNTSLCFVNSHLAAHMQEVERRSQDFRDINSKMSFSTGFTISDHDFVFWIGDLNYRLDMDYQQCLTLVKEQKYLELMNYDQLVRQTALKKVFLDYVEGKITFKPTYKYDPGTDNFDSSEKCRVPAYCDRILWRGSNIKQCVYRSHPALRISDHKPVSSVFSTGVKRIDEKKRQATYRDVMQKLDRLENDFLPQVALDTTEITFKNVTFIEPQTALLHVKNTGQVQVEYEFIRKLNETTICKPWLTVDPMKGVIPVGSICAIQIEVYVNPRTAAPLNCGDDRIEDILVLHLQGGKDLFVSVGGTYQPSCFGSSILGLVHTYRPVREVSTDTLIELEHQSSGRSPPSSPDRPLDVPKELWVLMDKLKREGRQVDDLFEQPGLHSEVQMIREALDTGQAVLPCTVYSAMYALYLLLESFPEPVIPYRYYTPALMVCSNFDSCKQVLRKLPASHRNVFKYLCAFLRYWLDSLPPDAPRQENFDFLAKQFGTLMLRRPPDIADATLEENRAESQNKLRFLRHFLVQPYDE